MLYVVGMYIYFQQYKPYMHVVVINSDILQLIIHCQHEIEGEAIDRKTTTV